MYVGFQKGDSIEVEEGDSIVSYNKNEITHIFYRCFT